MGNFLARLVGFLDPIHGHSKSIAGVCLASELLDYVQGMEDDALSSSREVTEKAVFNRIVLRAIRRVVSHTDGHLQSIRQFL